MNVTLSDVILTDPNGNRYACDNFFLKSRLIRYVHLSRTVSLEIQLLNNCSKILTFYILFRMIYL